MKTFIFTNDAGDNVEVPAANRESAKRKLEDRVTNVNAYTLTDVIEHTIKELVEVTA